MTQRFWAMDSDILVILPEESAEAIEHVRNLFEEWEQALSRFRRDSDLSRLNAAAGRPVAVREPLLGVLRRAFAAARATDGIFDPTMGTDLSQLGYGATFSSLPDVAIARPSAGPRSENWRDVRISPLGVVMMPEGLGIDLGGIAKGMAVDAALDALDAGGVAFALVSAGGDLAVLGRLPDDDAWPVVVAEDSAELTVALHVGALATSSTERRRWQSTAGAMHHLLDPRTRRPAASELIRATVHAPTCEQAEVAAKTALILGLDRGSAFLEQTGYAGLLSTRYGSHSIGAWPTNLPGEAA